MAKVGGVNRTGEVNTIAETATDQLARVTEGATPQVTANPFDAVMGDSPAVQQQQEPDLSALDAIEGETFDDPYAEARAAEELGREMGDPEADEVAQRVTPMSERGEVDRWGYRQGPEIDYADAEASFTNRIMDVGSKVGNSQVEDHALTFSKGSNLGKIATKLGANTTPMEQNIQLDDTFRYIVAARAEKFFADRMEGAKNEQMPQGIKQELEQEEQKVQHLDIKKATDSAQLGQEIAREYQREVLASQGQDSSSYNDLPAQEATILGDYAKEIYAAAMGDKIQRSIGPDDMVVFTLTPSMVAELDATKTVRNLYVPSQEIIDPLSTPEGEIKGEKHKYTKQVAGGLGKGVASSEAAQESLKNQGSIPHVVLPRRLKILLSTLLPSLMAGPQQYNNPLVEMAAEINGFGNSKVSSLMAKAQQKQDAGEHYDMNGVLRSIKQGAANSLMTVVKNRNKANYLTYYTQAFNTRQSPQQTHFNPTTSKIVRAVTGNAVPTVVTKNGKYFDAAIQAYAMLIGGDVDKVGMDAFLPEYRKNFLRTQAKGLEADGNRLLEILNGAMTDAEMETMLQAIEKGMAINDPNFPKPRMVGLDPQRDADLIKRIRDKGEDGVAYMDALMDFALFSKAMREGRSHPTYINPTIDGKTNGLAGIGLQMGIEKLATLTGVIRSPDAIHAVQNDHDIRDELKETLLADLKKSKFEGTFNEHELPAMVRLGESVFSHKPLNKEVTMTFGYGKEIESFIQSIIDTVYNVSQSDTKAKAALDYLHGRGWSNEEIARAMLNKYIPAMARVMSSDAMEARALHRGVALIHGMADELMMHTSATGDPIYIGGKSPEGRQKAGSYKMLEDGEMVQRTANMYPSKSTAAASKMRSGKDGPWEDVGGKALSGSVVAPIQSIDAATVIKSFSGPSWKMLKHNVKQPYMHQIYDAFKMDVATFHHMLPEINRNWADTAITWSALEQSKIALRKRAIPAWEKKLKALPAGQKVSLDNFPVIKAMLEGYYSEKQGRYVHAGLESRLKFLAPDNMTGSVRDEWVKKAALAIMSKSGATSGQTEMTRGELHKFMQAVLDVTNLDRRIANAYQLAEQKRAKLKKKVFDPNNLILQYFAH